MPSLLMLPVAVAVVRELDERTHLTTERSPLTSIAGTVALIAVYWRVLWRSGVRWTPTRGVHTTRATARCPECGSRFTLDELLADHPGRLGDFE